MLKAEIQPGEAYAIREIRSPGTPLQHIRILQHVRGSKWKAEWIDPNPGLVDYVESKDLYQTRPPGTRKVRVEFVDGEELVGHTRDDPAKRPGFFFSPFDLQSNNLRVFAVFDAVRRVERRL